MGVLHLSRDKRIMTAASALPQSKRTKFTLLLLAGPVLQPMDWQVQHLQLVLQLLVAVTLTGAQKIFWSRPDTLNACQAQHAPEKNSCAASIVTAPQAVELVKWQ